MATGLSGALAAYLASPAARQQADSETLTRMQHRYAHRLARPQSRAAPEAEATAPLTPFQQLLETVIGFERAELQRLRREAETSEDVLHKIENELDLEEARLALDRGE